MKTLKHVTIRCAPTDIKQLNGLSKNTAYKWKTTFECNIMHLPNNILNYYFTDVAKIINYFINLNYNVSINMSPYQAYYGTIFESPSKFAVPILDMNIAFRQTYNGRKIKDT